MASGGAYADLWNSWRADPTTSGVRPPG
jgi:hypothetical protein